MTQEALHLHAHPVKKRQLLEAKKLAQLQQNTHVVVALAVLTNFILFLLNN